MQWNFAHDAATCPVCEDTLMIRCNSKTWHIEHIIPMREGGPDIYYNTRPICVDCNLRMSKRAKSTFHHMAIIGKMTEREAIALEREHRERCEYLCNPQLNGNTDPLVCTFMLKNGGRCQRLAWGKDEEHCAEHAIVDLKKMDWCYTHKQN
jgi:hypothetical protein